MFSHNFLSNNLPLKALINSESTYMIKVYSIIAYSAHKKYGFSKVYLLG